MSGYEFEGEHKPSYYSIVLKKEMGYSFISSWVRKFQSCDMCSMVGKHRYYENSQMGPDSIWAGR